MDRTMRMRDRANRMMDRANRMMDRADRQMDRDMRMNDGRNPYGSRGGYVSSSRRDRVDYDYNQDGRNPYGARGGYVRDRRRDYGMDSNSDYNDYRKYNGGQGNSNDYGQDYERDGHNYERTREYYGSYGNVPFHIRGGENFDSRSDYNYGSGDRRDYTGDMRDYTDYNRDYRSDFRSGSGGFIGDGSAKLEKKDIEKWIDKLHGELEGDEKELFKMDKVIKKATEMGEKFDKYNEHELYVATLMIFTDYKHHIGKNVEMSINLAKDFLCDKDASVKYGEKLATYYDYIVEGE